MLSRVPQSALRLSLLSAVTAACITSTAIPCAHAAPAATAATTSSEIAGFGKLDPAPPVDLTPQQIIEKFASREAVFAHARENYTFRQTVRMAVLDEDTNKPKGEYQQITDISFSKAGRREEHVVFAPANTLDAAGITMSPADFEDIEHRLPFVLTTDDLPQYDIAYLGRQRVDDLDTYVFTAGPHKIVKNHRYFQGKVWVDQRDFQIVLINGKNVPDDVRKGHEDLSPPFTTYYEQVDNKYWFPTYTKAEGNLHFAAQDGALSQDAHIRTVVKYTDYKEFRSSSRIIYNGEDITGPTPATPTPPKP